GPRHAVARAAGRVGAGRPGGASGAGELMTLIVRVLGGGARSQRASLALLLERALSISVAQRLTLAVTGDRQLPSVQLGLAAELEARRQSRGEICPHGSEAGIKIGRAHV